MTELTNKQTRMLVKHFLGFETVLTLVNSEMKVGIQSSGCSIEVFSPLENLSCAIRLLDGLRKVSGKSWSITFESPDIDCLYSIHANGLSSVSGNNLCQLIVESCLWWMKKGGK